MVALLMLSMGAKSLNAARGSRPLWNVVEKRTFPPFCMYVKRESWAVARLGYWSVYQNM